MGRIIAIDYGKKRTGIAVTDPLQIIVTPLTTVSSDNIFDFLKSYFENEKVDKVILGFPLKNDNSDTDATPLVRQFAENFKKKFNHIPLHFQDERNTSKMATDAMVEGGFKKKHRQKKENLDMISAVFILKRHLNIL